MKFKFPIYVFYSNFAKPEHIPKLSFVNERYIFKTPVTFLTSVFLVIKFPQVTTVFFLPSIFRVCLFLSLMYKMLIKTKGFPQTIHPYPT